MKIFTPKIYLETFVKATHHFNHTVICFENDVVNIGNATHHFSLKQISFENYSETLFDQFLPIKKSFKGYPSLQP